MSRNNSFHLGGSTVDVLQKVSLDLLEMSICDRTYGNLKYYKNGLPKTMLCAGKLKGGEDTCQVKKFCSKATAVRYRFCAFCFREIPAVL